jgi:protein-arginine kinase
MKNRVKIDRIIESLRLEVSQFVEEESQITEAIEYEERVVELSKKFARNLTLHTQGKMPKSRNSKKKF